MVKDCLKAHLLGPTATRFLHNLSMTIKDVRGGGDRFFTFTLARMFTEPSELNPLFVLKELYETLLTSPATVEENLDQVIPQLAQMFVAFKSVLENKIVMRMPPGTREPFLDLTGPAVAPLPPAQRPSLDLPSNELCVLSKDKSEALGLFPYFTFDGKALVFGTPDQGAFKTLLERLEITDLA